MKNEYGQLTTMVATATTLMAAASAIILLVRRNAKWEPLQENLGRGAKNIGAVITAAAIGLIWANYRNDKNALTSFAIISGIGVLIALLLYSVIVGVYSYNKVIVINKKDKEIKIVGGFKLSKMAKENISKAPTRAGRSITIQEYFAGADYNSDNVWTRSSLELVKVIFILCYVILIAFGAVCLVATALRMAAES